MPEPTLVKVKIAIEKLKRYKPQGADRIPSEMTEVGGETLHIKIHEHICCIWNE